MQNSSVCVQENSIQKRYKYIKSLGHGGCGEVFLAENLTLGNYWAIKEIAKGEAASISAYIEPEILKRLNHPALPRICDVYEDDTKIYIIEDYIDGAVLKQELEFNDRFEEKQVIDWGIQLCSVLGYLHDQKPHQIIYGDLKPHNIIITSEGFIKLIDFGISSVLGIENSDKPPGILPNETAFIGTKGYAAPEQYLGAGSSRTTDIYSLGITLIQLISGIDPKSSLQSYYDEEFKEYMSDGLFRILQKCIQPNPENRYQTTAILMKELQSLSVNSGKMPSNFKNEKDLQLTRIIAFTGARGAGVSTLTAAAAEYTARGPTKACIVDLSYSGTLEKSLYVKKDKSGPFRPKKINQNLYYINLFDKSFNQEQLVLHKHLSKLQDDFSFIFIDSDISTLKSIEQYISQIFIVCDMNPYNIAELGNRIIEEKLSFRSETGLTFILNKFYKGELSSSKLLESIFLERMTLQTLYPITVSKIYEVPYDARVCSKWMYSCFGEPFKIGSLFSDKFGNAITEIVSGTIYPQKRHIQFSIKQLLSHIGGLRYLWARG